jgi:hypothetical protein
VRVDLASTGETHRGGERLGAPVLLLCQERLVFERGVDGAGELAFEAAERFTAALTVGFAAFEVGTGRRVDARLGDRDLVESAVELAVAAAVEAVALDAAAAGFERRDTGVPGELCVAAVALDGADFAE